jgi:hypothetical protein
MEHFPPTPQTRTSCSGNANETTYSSGHSEIPLLADQASLQDPINDNAQQPDSLEMTRLLKENGDVEHPHAMHTDTRAIERQHNTSASDQESNSEKAISVHLDQSTKLRASRKPDREKPKVIYSHRVSSIVMQFLLVHLLPVFINFFLLGIYIGGFLWTPPWPGTNVLNSLQFAAKIHESLMIASLSYILFHHVRYRLLASLAGNKSSGVPLGLVTSPFQITNLTFLISNEFWATVNDFSAIGIVTIFIHIFIIVIAALVGPASAIAMLPKLDSWELGSTISHTPFFTQKSYQFYLDGNLSSIFPENIVAAMSPEACNYNNLSLGQSNTCPGNGLSEILRGIPWPRDSDYEVSNVNITVKSPDPSKILSRTLSAVCDRHTYYIDEIIRPPLVIASATTLSDNIFFLTELLVSYYFKQRWPDSNMERDTTFSSIGDWTVQFLPNAVPLDTETATLWQQPVVSTFCSSESIDPAVRNLSALDMNYLFASIPKQTTIDAEYLLSILNGMNDIDIAFLEIARLNITPSIDISAAFLYRSSHNVTHFCLVDANWQNSTIEASHGVDLNADVIKSSIHVDNVRSMPGYVSKDINIRPISISTDWLVSLNMGNGANTNFSSTTSFFNALMDLCVRPPKLDLNNNSEDGHGSSNQSAPPDIECIATGFALAITEGLSKLPHNSPVYALGTPNPGEYWHGEHLGPVMQMSSWYNRLAIELESEFVGGNWSNASITPAQKAGFTRFDFTVKQRLYGYGFRSITVYLGFVVLFLYTLTVVVHIIFLLTGHRWSSRAWSSLGQLFILALRSPPPPNGILDNIGGGVKVGNTWRLRAKVRVLREGDNQVGLVIGDSEDGTYSENTKVETVIYPDNIYS